MNIPLPLAAWALIILKMKTSRSLLTAADKLYVSCSTLPWANCTIAAHYVLSQSRALCICTHMMYKPRSTIPYPAWIPAEALIPFSCYAFDRP